MSVEVKGESGERATCVTPGGDDKVFREGYTGERKGEREGCYWENVVSKGVLVTLGSD